MFRYALLILGAFAGPALAHPGSHHDSFPAIVAHLLTDPYHLALALCAGAAGVVGARLWKRSRARSRSQS